MRAIHSSVVKTKGLTVARPNYIFELFFFFLTASIGSHIRAQNIRNKKQSFDEVRPHIDPNIIIKIHE